MEIVEKIDYRGLYREYALTLDKPLSAFFQHPISEGECRLGGMETFVPSLIKGKRDESSNYRPSLALLVSTILESIRRVVFLVTCKGIKNLSMLSTVSAAQDRSQQKVMPMFRILCAFKYIIQ